MLFDDDEVTVPGVPPWQLMAKTEGEDTPKSEIGQVVKALNEFRAELAQLRPAAQTSPSFREIYEWFAPLYLPKKSAESFDGRVRNHLLPVLGELTSETLTSDVLTALFKTLEKTLKPGTLNHVRSHGRRIIRMAALRGKRWPPSAPNPFSEIDKRKVQRKRRDIPRAEEMGHLLDVIADPQFRNMVAFATYYGLRQDEVLGFPLKHIHLERDTLTVYSPKTEVTRELPIIEEFRPYLVDQMQSAKSQYFLFSRPNGSRILPGTKLRFRVRTAFKHAGLVRGYRHKCRRCKFETERPTGGIEQCPNGCMKLWVSPIPRNIDFHGLRHIASTLHRKAGCDPLIIQLLLGHSNGHQPLTDSVYTHFSEDDVRHHLNKLSLRAKGGGLPDGSTGGNGRGSSTAVSRPPKPKVASSTLASRASVTNSLGFLTIGEVMSGLRVSRNTVMNLIRGGRLAAFRIGSQLRIKKDEFERFLENSAEPTR